MSNEPHREAPNESSEANSTQNPSSEAKMSYNLSKNEGNGKEFIDMDVDTAPYTQDSEGYDISRPGKVLAGELMENTNILKSAFHVFKANVGTGVFMLPNFYQDAGFAASIFLALMIGTIVIDCTQLLLQTKLKINRTDITTYSTIARYVFGPPMAWFLFCALCLTQFGFCLMYSQLFSVTMDELFAFKNSGYLWPTLMLIIGFPMTCFSHNLSMLSAASVLASIGVTYALVCCITRSGIVIHNNRSRVHPTCNAFGRNIPIGWFNNLANNMMVLEGIGIVLPVHAACTQKRLVPKMTVVVLGIVIAVYLLIGIMGYGAFGNDLTTSLVTGMDHDAWGFSIRIFFMVNIVFTYPVQFMSAMQLIDQVVKSTPRSRLGLGLRFVINLAIWVLSMSLGGKAVNIVVAFIGAIPSTWIVMIIPSMMRTQVEYAVEHSNEDRTTLKYWKVALLGVPGRRFTWLRIRCIAYILLAFLIMVIGTYSIFTTEIFTSDS
ncbi:unnamed protein product [Phytomonas sp. EM1]|nr:unnamed protein product [Phytomonas sp. EM1]|eukprot:CCW63581.1 unnamed protein product [Phytomonas sp. isolate EM1]